MTIVSEGTAAAAQEGGYAPCSVTRETFARQPEDYRRHIIRIMSIQAYAERLGAIELGYWVAKAPTYKDRRICARICADEAAHAYWLYRELDRIGVGEDEAIAIAEGKSGKGPASASLAGPRAVADEDNRWEDVPLNNMFLDRAGRYMVGNFANSSYAPWAKVSRRILKDERLHEGFGLRELRRQIRAACTREERDALARRVTKWYALGLNFFGPPRSSQTETLRAYGIKRLDNEQLRTAYRQECDDILASLGGEDLVRFSSDRFPYS